MRSRGTDVATMQNRLSIYEYRRVYCNLRIFHQTNGLTPRFMHSSAQHFSSSLMVASVLLVGFLTFWKVLSKSFQMSASLRLATADSG